MPMKACIDRIVKASGMTGAAAGRLMDDLDRRSERLAREKGLTPSDAVNAAFKEISDAETAASAIEERNRLLNLQKRMARRARIEQTAEDLKGDFVQAVRNQVVAIATPVRGGRLSAEATWKARASEYYGRIVTALQNEGLLRAVRDGSLDDAWGRELFELSRKAAGDADAKPGLTGNAQALRIAEIFHAQQELARARLNREGAWIGQYAGYISRTSHDADIIRRAGFEKWRSFIEPRLDERTFDGIDDREQFLRDVHAALSTGVHLSDEGGIGYKDPAFSGPANLARKASESRVLHFNDATGWLAYQREYATGTLIEQMLASFDHAARQEALMQRWGTNPQAEFDADIRYLSEQHRDTAMDQVANLREKASTVQQLFAMLDGSANRPANKWAAQLASDVRTVESMAKLGMVAFTHLSAAVTKAAELRYQGVGIFERYANFFESLLQGRGKGEAAELADLLLAGAEGMHGKILNRFTPDDTVPGTLSKLANRFFSATGLTWLLDAQKAGAQRIMSRHLGSFVETDFARLPLEVQRGLRQYDISAAEWDVLRQAPDHFEMGGRTFLTPDAAARAPDDAIAAAWKQERTGFRIGKDGSVAAMSPERDPTGADLTGYRDRLALKLHGYMQDVADRAIVTPGIADRALLTMGTRPGTVAGEALRFVSQFKLWGIAAVRQGLGRELYGGQGLAGAASGVIQMAIGAAVMGYVTMTLKDLAKGLTPHQPNDPKTWMAAMIQGGGFGIMGDFLFGEFGRFGESPGEAVLGPVLGQGLTELFNIWNSAKEGRAKDIPPEAARVVTNNLPFVNLFYTRSALNYLFLHSLQEAMNPGYLRRSEQRLKQRTGQTYMLSPAANHLQTFGR